MDSHGLAGLDRLADCSQDFDHVGGLLAGGAVGAVLGQGLG
jgi:hypothetical protein